MAINIIVHLHNNRFQLINSVDKTNNKNLFIIHLLDNTSCNLLQHSFRYQFILFDKAVLTDGSIKRRV